MGNMGWMNAVIWVCGVYQVIYTMKFIRPNKFVRMVGEYRMETLDRLIWQ